MTGKDSKLVCAHVIIRGRVQGVFFRAETQRQAQHLGVKGWVRNLPDASVEAYLQGDAAAVEQMIAWCRHGPPAAHVDELELRWIDADKSLTGFQMRYGL